MSHKLPYRWTAMIALVRGVMAASTRSGSMHQLTGIDIDEYRRRAEVDDRRGRGDPVGVGQDHFVTRADVRGRQAHVQCAGAARCRDCEFRRRGGLESRLESIDVLVAMLAPAVPGGIGGIFHLRSVIDGFVYWMRVLRCSSARKGSRIFTINALMVTRPLAGVPR